MPLESKGCTAQAIIGALAIVTTAALLLADNITSSDDQDTRRGTPTTIDDIVVKYRHSPADAQKYFDSSTLTVTGTLARVEQGPAGLILLLRGRRGRSAKANMDRVSGATLAGLTVSERLSVDCDKVRVVGSPRTFVELHGCALRSEAP